MANNFSNSINSNIGASNTGATNTLTVTNPSNTASSNALVNVTVGGTSAGDAFTTYTVAGTTNWSQGVDNSASDAFVIAASTALGTTNVMSMTTGGAVSCVLGNFDVTKSASGADVSVTSSNTSNTASSTATNYLTVAGTSAGDARVQYAVSGTTTWTEGIDNSDSDAFVLAASTALGTTNVIRAATGGQINYPLQPCFMAYSNNPTNVTGDGTVYTIAFAGELIDVGNNFNTSTYTFTAPVTGNYLFNVMVCFALGGSAPTFCRCGLVTTGAEVEISYIDGAALIAAQQNLSGSVILPMTATNTAYVYLNMGNSTKTVGILGASTVYRTWFSGMLLS